jgi:molybdopterin converting factor small subunit
MPIVVEIPSALREFSGGRDELRIAGTPATVGEALAGVFAECPGLRDRVLTERGDVRPHVNIFVDGENSRFHGGLGMKIPGAKEIMILPAVSGGSSKLTAHGSRLIAHGSQLNTHGA